MGRQPIKAASVLIVLALASIPALSDTVQSPVAQKRIFIQHLSAAPTGACTPTNATAIVRDTGCMYTCPSGTWALSTCPSGNTGWSRVATESGEGEGFGTEAAFTTRTTVSTDDVEVGGSGSGAAFRFRTSLERLDMGGSSGPSFVFDAGNGYYTQRAPTTGPFMWLLNTTDGNKSFGFNNAFTAPSGAGLGYGRLHLRRADGTYVFQADQSGADLNQDGTVDAAVVNFPMQTSTGAVGSQARVVFGTDAGVVNGGTTRFGVFNTYGNAFDRSKVSKTKGGMFGVSLNTEWLNTPAHDQYGVCTALTCVGGASNGNACVYNSDCTGADGITDVVSSDQEGVYEYGVYIDQIHRFGVAYPGGAPQIAAADGTASVAPNRTLGGSLGLYIENQYRVNADTDLDGTPYDAEDQNNQDRMDLVGISVQSSSGHRQTDWDVDGTAGNERYGAVKDIIGGSFMGGVYGLAPSRNWIGARGYTYNSQGAVATPPTMTGTAYGLVSTHSSFGGTNAIVTPSVVGTRIVKPFSGYGAYLQFPYPVASSGKVNYYTGLLVDKRPVADTNTGRYGYRGAYFGAGVHIESGQKLIFNGTMGNYDADGTNDDGYNASYDGDGTVKGVYYSSGTIVSEIPIQIGQDGLDGSLKLYSEQGATDYTVTVSPNAAMTMNTPFVLPASCGSSGQVIKTDGNCNLSFQSDLSGDGSGGGGAPVGASYLVLGLDSTLSGERQMVAGAGLAATDAGGDGSYTLATASTEAGFLASGALTCTTGTAGKAEVHTTPLQYCDNSATPTLRYAAYGNSAGAATAVASDSVALTTATTGNYVASVATSSPLTGGATGSEGATLTLGCQAASGAQAGCLSSTDWTTFNSKVPTTLTLTAGAGLSGGGDLSTNRSFATDSSEADFLASGALTCGAGTQGEVKVHTTPLQYCDNAATPALQYAAYGDSAGAAKSGDSATAFFSTGALETAYGGTGKADGWTAARIPYVLNSSGLSDDDGITYNASTNTLTIGTAEATGTVTVWSADGTRGTVYTDNTVNPDAPSSGSTTIHTKAGTLYVLTPTGTTPGNAAVTGTASDSFGPILWAAASTSCTTACTTAALTCVDAYPLAGGSAAGCSSTTDARSCMCK